jgi:hypothetical protein
VYEGEVGASLNFFRNYPYNQVVNLNAADVRNRYPAIPAVDASTSFDPMFAFANYPSHAKNPATQFQGFSIQREIGRHYLAEIGYMGNRSYHLAYQGEANPAVLTSEQAAQVARTKDPNSISSVVSRRIHREWGSRVVVDTSAYSRYHAGYVKFDRRFSRGLLLGVSYTWSGAFSLMDNAAGLARPADWRNLQAEYARSAYDRPHRFVVFYSWQTPGKQLWSGWRISGVSQWQSGQPFTVTTGVDSNGDGVANTDRPDYNPAGILRLDPVTGDWRTFESPLIGGRFVTPLNSSGTPLQFSTASGWNLGRNTFRGPALAMWSLSVGKAFRIAERGQFEVRVDATNALNHRNFGPPVGIMNNPLAFGSNSTSPDGRTMLLGAKLRF